MYSEDEMLMLSGIQHFMFCPRQWALIHMEQLWNDNKLTTEGSLIHKNVDNPFYRRKNGNSITLRSMHIASKQLGLYGIADAIELIPSETKENAILHDKYKGYWKPFPIEYKRGHSKPDERDEVQLAAQAICLEEMFGIEIGHGALFYDETKHRETIAISSYLRKLTQNCANEMHRIYKTWKIPEAEEKKHCRSCSLKDLCMPGLNMRRSAKNYIERNLYEDIT